MIRNVRIDDYASLLPKIEEIQFYSGRWHRNAVLEPAAITNLKRVAIATSAGSSTRIEGATLSDQQALEVIRKKKIVFEERSAGEVLGYAEALDWVFQKAVCGRSVVDREILFALHRKLMRYTPTGRTGRFRLEEVNVADGKGGALLICALPDLVPGFTRNAINHLCGNWKDPRCSKLLQIAEFVAEFLAIHPFEDGNGRCARLLTVYLLHRAGHEYIEYTSLEKQIEKNKMQYYLSLNEAQKTGRLDRWLHFFFDTLLAAQEDLEARLRASVALPWAVRSVLQKEVLDLFKTTGTLKAGEIIELTKKSPAGVRKALALLVKKKLVASSGKNRGRYYRLAG